MKTPDIRQTALEILLEMLHGHGVDDVHIIIAISLHRKMTETRSALDWLVEEGLLLETSLPGTEPIFSLNPEMRDKAEQLLKNEDRSSSGDEECR